MDVRQKAIEVALSLTSGAYQTSLVSYFTHRDLFPALMKVGNINFFGSKLDEDVRFRQPSLISPPCVDAFLHRPYPSTGLASGSQHFKVYLCPRANFVIVCARV